MRPGNLKNHQVLTTKFSPQSYQNAIKPGFQRLASLDSLIANSVLIRMSDVRFEAIIQYFKTKQRQALLSRDIGQNGTCGAQLSSLLDHIHQICYINYLYLHFRWFLSSCLSLSRAPFSQFGFIPCFLPLLPISLLTHMSSPFIHFSRLAPCLLFFGKQYVFPPQVLVYVFFFLFYVNLKTFAKSPLHFSLSAVDLLHLEK